MFARLSPLAAVALITIAGGAASAAPVLNPANGHYYDVINTSPGVNWATANSAASALSFMGVQGHLVTITTAQENQFLTSTFGAGALHFHWTGGLQPAGSTEPGGGWSWVTGEPFAFNNWWPGEPNNSGGIENRIIFDHGTTANGKSWNDLRDTALASGYVVEYDTPEPVSLVVFGSLALAGVGVVARRRRRE